MISSADSIALLGEKEGAMKVPQDFLPSPIVAENVGVVVQAVHAKSVVDELEARKSAR
jgi:hypothetical protein